jgi:hypothetical protein
MIRLLLFLWLRAGAGDPCKEAMAKLKERAK